MIFCRHPGLEPLGRSLGGGPGLRKLDKNGPSFSENVHTQIRPKIQGFLIWPKIFKNQPRCIYPWKFPGVPIFPKPKKATPKLVWIFCWENVFSVVGSTLRFRTSVVGLEAAKPPRSSASSSKPGESPLALALPPWVDWDSVDIHPWFFLVGWTKPSEQICGSNKDLDYFPNVRGENTEFVKPPPS